MPSPNTNTKRVDRRNWNIVKNIGVEAHKLYGDVKSVTKIEYTIDSLSGKSTEYRRGVFKFNEHGDVVEYIDSYNEGEHTTYQYEYDSNGFPIAAVEQHFENEGETRKWTTIYINRINYQGLLEEWQEEDSENFEHFTYDDEGNLASMTYYYEGLSSEHVGDCEYKYNRDGKIVAINDETGRFNKEYYTCNYDSNGELVEVYHLCRVWRGEIESSTYVCKRDPKSGLLEVISKDGKTTYRHDRHGNLIEKAVYYNLYDKYPSYVTEYKISYRLFGLF